MTQTQPVGSTDAGPVLPFFSIRKKKKKTKGIKFG
jgi:hypothetical protein